MSKVDATATVDADTGEIVAALFGLVDTLKAHFEHVAAEFGLTPTQALALRCLDEPQAMGDLAGHLRCERSNVTAIGNRPEALRLVRRTTHPSDRRVTRLELTAAGRSRRDGEHQRVDRCGTRSAQRPGRHRQRPTRVGEVVDE